MRLVSTVLLGMFVVIFSFKVMAAEDAHHFPGVVLGGTHIDGETDFTFGFEYEYKLDKKWGLGAVFERSNDGHDGDGVAVWVASAFYHPTSYMRLGIGFGEEKIGGAHPHT